MSLFPQITHNTEQLETLLNEVAATSPHTEALKRARVCLTEAFEHIVYAARDEIEAEGVHYECSECGRSFPLHYGDTGCPEGHESKAILITRM